MTVVTASSQEETTDGTTQVAEVAAKEPKEVVPEKEEEEDEDEAVYVSSEDELDLKLSSPLIPVASDQGDHKDNEARPTTYQLCTYEESPAYLQHNPFIHKGYRVNFSFHLCLHSLFRLHNESWNIWTHLFGFAVFLWLGARLMSVMEWRMMGEPFLFMAFILTVEASMLSSAIFHAFNCHSPCTYKWTCRFDYSSISMLVVGSYAPMLYYAFICEPFWQRLYLASFLLLGVIGVVISFLPFFSTPQYRVYRTCVFLALGWSTLMPLPHMLYSHGLWAVWQIARWELLVGLIYSIGAVIYAKRIPERWYPGKYDFSLMGSHSLWHCFTVVGALVQLHACISVYEAFGTLLVCA